MKRKLMLVPALAVLSLSMAAQPATVKSRIVVNTDMGKETISKHIYGHFSEHLGRCIYGGYWVGEGSPVPNTRGIRNDVVEALRKTGIPNLRWPGGCFADEYHWMDGIGPRANRPKMINTHWGGVTEDNSFGTNEFLDLCGQLGAEPYICGNVGSGTVEELSDWVEYVNFNGISPMADLRRANGRDSSWNVKFWGIGNETWGCGGHMTADYYTDQFRRYATYTRDYGNNHLLKIACGASDTNFEWTETLMKKIPHWMMWGISFHNYTTNWSNKGSATKFTEKEYFETLERCLAVKSALDRHITIMDKYDPGKEVALVVDEWGTWWDVEPGTNPGFLYQQNTMRDAMVAAISLNYFNERCDRVRMANIAQTVNVLQSLILTDGDRIVLTPTYHVFEMFRVHHDATLLPVNLETGSYSLEGRDIPEISVSASKDSAGKIHISLVNVDPGRSCDMSIELRGGEYSHVTGRLLGTGAIDSYNTFDRPDAVRPVAFEKARLRDDVVSLVMPPASIIVLEIYR